MDNGVAFISKRIENKRTHVLMLFLDGVGIGKKDEHYNPFFAAEMANLRELMGGKMFHLRNTRFNTSRTSTVALNATLGVGGLPQSGTNQAALLTGFNAPRHIGKHFGPYLYSSLKEIVSERSIFRKLLQKGMTGYYANAFPQQYFDYLKSDKHHTTAFPFAWISAGNKLNDGETLVLGKSLSADITNERWISLGYRDTPVISPQEAGKRLINLTRECDFVLYEYFFTDHAGHSQSMSEALKVLELLDKLLQGIMADFDWESMLLIILSDHGNIEDLSNKSHTRNPVPLIAAGRYHTEITFQAKKITDVVPLLLNMLN